MRIVLASASPRRRDLLSAAGLLFEVRAGEIDESLPSGTPAEAGAVLLAERKARSAARDARADELVLAADTIVALGDVLVADVRLGDELLGKAADAHQARAMLRKLSGTRHRVVTGVCALRARDGALHSAFERTFVTMRAIEEGEIEAYVRSGEWEGKAGAYAIQESADRFVTRLEEGGFDNVVGLPVRLALDLLARLGAEIPRAR